MAQMLDWGDDANLMQQHMLNFKIREVLITYCCESVSL